MCCKSTFTFFHRKTKDSRRKIDDERALIAVVVSAVMAIYVGYRDWRWWWFKPTNEKWKNNKASECHHKTNYIRRWGWCDLHRVGPRTRTTTTEKDRKQVVWCARSNDTIKLNCETEHETEQQKLIGLLLCRRLVCLGESIVLKDAINTGARCKKLARD